MAQDRAKFLKNQTECLRKQIKSSTVKELAITCLKGRGFRFEDTHMTTLKRIETLMALLAIGFCWAHKVGEWRANTQKSILFKTHRDSFRPQNNFFRYAFHFIRDNLINFFKKISQLKLCLQPFTRSFLFISFFNFCPVLT